MVTGSRIKQSATETPAPVLQTVSAQDLTDRGFVTAGYGC